jgi:hypothetical protein
MFEDIKELKNTSGKAIEVCVEPWGMVYSLPAGQIYKIIGRSEQEGHFDIVKSESMFAVYAWPGCTYEVLHGENQIDKNDFNFPDLPTGMSTKSMIELIFGGPGEPRTSTSGKGTGVTNARKPWWKFWGRRKA